MKTVAPVVNMNGTKRSDLYEQNFTALKAVEEARWRLADAVPHGRDYQTAEAGAYAVAREQHIERLQRLTAIEKELQEILESLMR